MLKYGLRRLGVALLVALTVSVTTFSLIYLAGDPAMALAGDAATEADIRNIRRVYGYDRPIVVQYANWLGDAFKALAIPEELLQLVGQLRIALDPLPRLGRLSRFQSRQISGNGFVQTLVVIGARGLVGGLFFGLKRTRFFSGHSEPSFEVR